MATLKGQNFRIYTEYGHGYYVVVGMATSCTVNLTSNTDDSSTKDYVGLATKQSVTSKSWNVSVESLDVSDVAAMLTAIKTMTPFILAWDETSTTDNQTSLGASVARYGTAYLTDAVFAFNDRENSTKSLTFTGSGPLDVLDDPLHIQPVSSGFYTKGQFVRLFLGSDNTTAPAKVLAAAKQLSFHVSLSMEDATTKDTLGDWQVQEPTALSYDISTTALMRSGETISSSVEAQDVAGVENLYENANPVKFQIANVSGQNNRTKGAVIVSGSVLVTSLTLNGPNRANADYSATLTGWGEYTVGS